MTDAHEPDIRRRPDGSIDMDFYVRRARRQHALAISVDMPRWLSQLRALIGSLLFPGRQRPGLPGR